MENLTWYSINDLNKPMDLLLKATEKIKFDDDFYDTISIFGDSPTQQNINPQEDNDLAADCESNYCTNNLTESIFTPWKSESSQFKAKINDDKASIINDREINPDSILKCQIEVLLFYLQTVTFINLESRKSVNFRNYQK